MGIYISPKHFQVAHYYFFCMAISSFTTAILFYFEPFYSYIFLVFYVIHTIIAWFITWFLHKRMQDIFIINSSRFFISHVILSIWSSSLSIELWYVFKFDYNMIITSLFAINFFVIFLGIGWYLISRLGMVRKFFEWYDSHKAKSFGNVVLKLRKNVGRRLASDKNIKDYKHGTNQKIDKLFLQIKRERGKRNKVELFISIRDLEIEIWEGKIRELEERIEKLGGEGLAKKELVESYKKLINSYTGKRMEYEKYFFKKFGV